MTYVVLGSSAAGVSGARELRRLNSDAKIIMISKDDYPYSRCILHHYLSGERNKEQISFVEKDFEQLYGVDFIKGQECTALDTEKKNLRLSDGRLIDYDKLLIATGASSFLPPIPGLAGTKNVIGFRNIDDIEEMKKETADKQHIVIMGAGLVGVDALTGFLHLGKKPALVEMADRLLSKQLDKRAANTYEKVFEDKGAKFYFGVGVQEIKSGEDGAVKELILTDGATVPCDYLVVTIGVRSNVGFLKDSGVETDKFGLLIDSGGKTNVPDVFGAGDVTGRSPIWPVAVKEGMIAAKNMSGQSGEITDYFASKSTMNFEGIPSMSLGINEKPDDSYTEELFDNGTSYKKVIHKDGKIYGAVLQGDLSYGGILTQLIANNIDVSKVKKPLFEVDYSDFFHIDSSFEFYYEDGGA